MVDGYLSEAYAQSFAEFGTVLPLANSGGWLLSRTISSTPYVDAAGAYPLLCCNDWGSVKDDIAEYPELVSVVAVIDPFCPLTLNELRAQFGFARSYKAHFIINPRKPKVNKHHRYYTRQSLKSVEVEACENPQDHFADWCDLYAQLVVRHQIVGMTKFSTQSFQGQFDTPGFVLFRAMSEGVTISMHSWYQGGGIAYSHLAASNVDGYRLSAPYALHQAAIDHFNGKVRALDLGAGAGVKADLDDGLTRFKRGWSSYTLPARLCGTVLKPSVYQRLSRRKEKSDYFPLYRA